MDVLFVKPDYFGTTPKACMDGWARLFLQIVPDGRVVPCHAATSITSLTFDDVRKKPVPFPPEPLRDAVIHLTLNRLDAAEQNKGQRRLCLGLLDRARHGLDR